MTSSASRSRNRHESRTIFTVSDRVNSGSQWFTVAVKKCVHGLGEHGNGFEACRVLRAEFRKEGARLTILALDLCVSKFQHEG